MSSDIISLSQDQNIKMFPLFPFPLQTSHSSRQIGDFRIL